jgi:argininosuccinate lyase
MAGLMVSNMEVRNDLLKDEKYKYLFSVEEVNKLVLKGMPFRDAYKKIGRDIESGTFRHEPDLHHTHEGSLGNLQNEAIAGQMNKILSAFPFQHIRKNLEELLKSQ